MEAMALRRMKPWAEDNHWLSSAHGFILRRAIASITWQVIPHEQARFQPHRPTNDVVAHIYQTAMDQLHARQRTLLVAVDFKAAFDRVWRGGLLRDLAEFGLSRRCLRCLKSWLSDRRSTVKWNDAVSRPRILSQGTPPPPKEARSHRCYIELRLPH